MSELKKIDLDSGQFMANGKKYVIERSLSIERYAMYQQLELEVGYGLSFKDLFNNMRQAYDLLNAGKLADAAVIMNNSMRGVAKLEQKEPQVLRYCALICNTEDEDRRSITEDQISAKIKDWQEEGLDIADFFSLALRSLPGFIKIWQSNSQDSIKSQQDQPSQSLQS